jgi:hypothetical protein
MRERRADDGVSAHLAAHEAAASLPLALKDHSSAPSLLKPLSHFATAKQKARRFLGGLSFWELFDRTGQRRSSAFNKDEICQNPLEGRIVRAMLPWHVRATEVLGNFTCTPAQDRLPLYLERR